MNSLRFPDDLAGPRGESGSVFTREPKRVIQGKTTWPLTAFGSPSEAASGQFPTPPASRRGVGDGMERARVQLTHDLHRHSHTMALVVKDARGRSRKGGGGGIEDYRLPALRQSVRVDLLTYLCRRGGASSVRDPK